MSIQLNTINIVFPYCGEAQGIDSNAWLDSVEKNRPSQINTRLFFVFSTTSDDEKRRKFLQRAKTIFSEVVEVPKYKPSPLTLEDGLLFLTYCFMTAWPAYDRAGAGVMINPLWHPTEKNWLDNYIAVMRVNQKAAIALGIYSDQNKSEIFGCLGYSEQFFTLFKNYRRFVAGSSMMDRLGWEFKKYGHHASSTECPFEKVSDDKSPKKEAFVVARTKSKVVEPDKQEADPIPAFLDEKETPESKESPEDTPEEAVEDEPLIKAPVLSDDHSKKVLIESLGGTVEEAEQVSMPKIPEPPKKRGRKPGKKAAKKATKKRAKKRAKKVAKQEVDVQPED